MAVESAILQPSLTLKRRLKAPPGKVFAAWTDPEKMKRWMGPGEVKTMRAESDTRVGGRYRIADMSAATLPEDFARNPRIHRCYEIRAPASA